MSADIHWTDRYELQERLSQGRVTELWRALDTHLRRSVAIWTLSPDLRDDPGFGKRFESEVRLLASLHHPNIIQIHDFQLFDPPNPEGPIAALVMDFVEGQNLAQYIQDTMHKGNFLSNVELLALFTPICLGIEYAHQQGVIHGDLRPSTILLDAQNLLSNSMGEPIVSDFGVSNLLSNSDQFQQDFWSSASVYVPSEQIQSRHIDASSDVYALSVILYEICTGVLPYQTDNQSATTMQHLSENPTPPALINPKITPPLAGAILRGIAKDPSSRYNSASSLLVALAEALDLPVPESVGYAIQGTDMLNAPTYVPPKSDPSLPASAALSAAETVTPARSMAPPASSANSLLAASPGGTLQHERSMQRRPLFIGLLLLLLAGVVAAVFLIVPRFSAPSPQQGRGTVYFLNSGQINQDGSTGVTDQVQIDLTSLPPPSSGNAYYAWLLSDTKQSDVDALLLGNLSVSDGKVHTIFHGDAAHANILAHYSRFLVSEESASLRPVHPESDTWRYYGQIAQQPAPADTTKHYSLLDHVRHLVSDEPNMRARKLYGGLNLWLGRNAEKLLEAASTARDEKDPDLVHRSLIRSLDYLDGKAQSTRDLPLGTSFLIDPLAGQVGLLTFDQQQLLPGLLTHVETHLEGLVNSPGITPSQRSLGTQLDQATKLVQKELTQAYQDAKQLVAMPDAQLSQPPAKTLLNDLYQQVNQAYAGQITAGSGTLKNGIESIVAQLQNLATVDITPYKQS